MGVSNGWSLYGGSIVAGDYNALSAGIGRDLMAFGALSFDTHSWAKFLVMISVITVALID